MVFLVVWLWTPILDPIKFVSQSRQIFEVCLKFKLLASLSRTNLQCVILLSLSNFYLDLDQ